MAVKHPAIEGDRGVTVRGNEIAVKPVSDVQFEAGEGVETVEKKGKLRFYSSRSGCVYDEAGSLQVRPEVQVGGDVDYNTGNIECKGDLIIRGTVRSGFTAKAEGNVIVGEGVENGAQIKAGRSVVVSKGIFGQKTRVIAAQNITAQFVQDATLVCRGELEIGGYVYNASVRGGTVIVHGKGDRGGIVGGRVVARENVTSTIVGSEFGTSTQVVAGVDEELRRSLQKVNRGEEFCRIQIHKLKQSLNLSSVDARAIGEMVSRAPTTKRKGLRELGHKLEKLVEMADKVESQKHDLLAKQESVARQASIRVESCLYPKVELFIGQSNKKTRDMIKSIALSLGNDGQIEAVPLEGQEVSH